MDARPIPHLFDPLSSVFKAQLDWPYYEKILDLKAIDMLYFCVVGIL